MLRSPNVWSSDWSCPAHGPVLPLAPVRQPSVDLVEHVLLRTRVPLWLPWPLPPGWLVTGIAHAGDERTGIRAAAVACSGPNPLGGAGELVLIAEEPGIGLGARYGGLDGPDPGEGFDVGPASAKIEVGGHPTPLWVISGKSDRAVFVGEARGLWLWLVFWPDTAGHLVADSPILVDMRDLGAETELVPFGALTPRLTTRE
jgi:hypothetical protein